MLKIKQETESAIDSKVTHFTQLLDTETLTFSRQLQQFQKRQSKILHGHYSDTLLKFLSDASVISGEVMNEFEEQKRMLLGEYNGREETKQNDSWKIQLEESFENVMKNDQKCRQVEDDIDALFPRMLADMEFTSNNNMELLGSCEAAVQEMDALMDKLSMLYLQSNEIHMQY